MRNNAPIDGIVLAAGRSSRMGRPKALLAAGDETFLARAVRLLADAGCRSVIVVLAADDAEGADRALVAGASVARNPDADSEPIDSVRAGLQATADAEAALILPVDLPLIQPRTVSALVRAWRASGARILLPETAGQTGHPILLDRSLFAEVLSRPLAEGLHTLIRDNADTVQRVPVSDPGIHDDVDTPDEYARHFADAVDPGRGAEP
jgi:CTP:molybdopterin cytidylyltransferase MocA